LTRLNFLGYRKEESFILENELDNNQFIFKNIIIYDFNINY